MIANLTVNQIFGGHFNGMPQKPLQVVARCHLLDCHLVLHKEHLLEDGQQQQGRKACFTIRDPGMKTVTRKAIDFLEGFPQRREVTSAKKDEL